MIATLACGAEEPLTRNEQLLELDEDTGAIELATTVQAALARYSFVPTNIGGPDPYADVFARLRAVLGEALWIIGWNHRETGDERIRSRAVRSRLERLGWMTLVRPGLGLAGRRYDERLGEGLAPRDLEPRMGACFVLFGESMRFEALGAPPFENTMRLFCLGNGLHPSAQFLDGLAANASSIAYLSTGGADARGLVVVAPGSLSQAVARMENEGVIGSPLRNERAPEVWR